jgi:hypothetical protein
MPGEHEVSEEIEHAVHENKGIALLIAVLALFLAFASAGGKGAQTEAISENVESANLWAFFKPNPFVRPHFKPPQKCLRPTS